MSEGHINENGDFVLARRVDIPKSWPPKFIPMQPLGEIAEHWAKLGLISPRWVVFVKLLDIESPGL